MVQNPFLFGTYLLRREQLAMQIAAESREKIKERYLYYPTTFKNLELVMRNNFSTAIFQKERMMFYSSSELANDAMKGK